MVVVVEIFWFEYFLGYSCNLFGYSSKGVCDSVLILYNVLELSSGISVDYFGFKIYSVDLESESVDSSLYHRPIVFLG